MTKRLKPGESILFEPHGPCPLPAAHRGAKRIMDPEDVEEFWRRQDHIAARRGCYIFAMRASAGYTPYYVGKTTRDFRHEALSDRNLAHFITPILAGRPGTGVLFFLAEPRKRGQANSRAINQLERELIEYAAMANPELRNKSGRREPRWGIRGILRSGPGQPSLAAQHLKKCLGM